jgi:hypothetical protein
MITTCGEKVWLAGFPAKALYGALALPICGASARADQSPARC